MTTKSTSKLKENNEIDITQTKSKSKSETDKSKLKIHDFMPGWAKEEKCFKDAKVRDYDTKKIVEDRWPRLKPTAQLAYENWLSAVVNQDTGEFYQQRNEEGIAIKNTSKSEEVYDMEFTPDNVLKLYEKVEHENIMFVLKDLKTQDAREVKWSSVKDTLDLFCNKSFEYLWKADYMPPPVKAELRQEAVAQGLIHGVQSDYSTSTATTTSSSSSGGTYS